MAVREATYKDLMADSLYVRRVYTKLSYYKHKLDEKFSDAPLNMDYSLFVKKQENIKYEISQLEKELEYIESMEEKMKIKDSCDDYLDASIQKSWYEQEIESYD
jgi:hypothetical protein